MAIVSLGEISGLMKRALAGQNAILSGQKVQSGSIHDSFVLSSLEEFLKDFDAYRALYETLEGQKECWLTRSLHESGRQVREGKRQWTRSDFEDIVRWKRLQPLMPRIEKNAPDIEKRLFHAFKVEDEEDRIQALCKIPGIGPVLASAVLMFTSPKDYGILDYHTWNALARLGFDLPRKISSGGNFTIPELLQYLKIIRSLAKDKNTTAREVDKALHALDKVKKKQKWKDHFDSINTSLLPSGFGDRPTNLVS